MSFNHRFGWSTVLMPYLSWYFISFSTKKSHHSPRLPALLSHTLRAQSWQVQPIDGRSYFHAADRWGAGMQRCSESSLTSIARQVMDVCTALSLGGSKSPPKLTINPCGRHHLWNRKLGLLKQGKVSQRGEIWVLHLTAVAPLLTTWRFFFNAPR